MKRNAKPRAKPAAPPTYDGEVLGILAGEFPSSPRAEADRKIRRTLRAKKLGEYDAARIDMLRRFKDTVQAEVHRFTASAYYVATGDPLSDYAEMEDFDRERMAQDYASAFPSIAPALVAQFVDLCVFLCHVR